METPLTLQDLSPDPRDEWHRLLRFVGWGEQERLAAARSVEPLFLRGHDLVARTYEHLATVPETARILGGERGPDPEHLAERRRFLMIWLARTLGLDTSDEFALYLFRAGLMHHGLGPRRVTVPPEYVVGSVGLIQAGFADALATAGLPSDVTALALGAWSRYLSVQLDLMLSGYRAASALVDGEATIRCTTYGRLRHLWREPSVQVATASGDTLADVLRKLFGAYPEVRAEVLDRVWEEREPDNTLWPVVVPAFQPRPGWRLLLNGKDARYNGGLQQPVTHGDAVSLFPPGR
jgi:molybdopterin converting factor small subunit